MELAQQAQNALVELETEGGTPSGQLHAQRGPKMREAKRKRAEEDMKSILVGGGDEEAETLNGEVGGTTLRVLRSKAVTPQRAPKRGPRASKGKQGRRHEYFGERHGHRGGQFGRKWRWRPPSFGNVLFVRGSNEVKVL